MTPFWCVSMENGAHGLTAHKNALSQLSRGRVGGQIWGKVFIGYGCRIGTEPASSASWQRGKASNWGEGWRMSGFC